VREGAGPKALRKEGEMRIPDEEGIRKEEREWKEWVGERGKRKRREEKGIGIDSAPRYQARENNMRRRTASARSRIGVAGLYQRSYCHVVGHQ